MRKQFAPAPPAPPAEIRAGVAYPLQSFMQLAGVGRHGLRAMKKRGLRVTYTSNRGYVKGDDFLAFIDAQHANACE